MFKRLMYDLEDLAFSRNFNDSIQGRLAEALEWSVVSGGDLAMVNPVLNLVADADRAGAKVLEDSAKYDALRKSGKQTYDLMLKIPGMDRVLNSVQVACGRLDGHEIYIFPGSSDKGKSDRETSSRRKLDVVLIFKDSLDFKLHMYRETWLSRLGKLLFRVQDVGLGDPMVDDAYMIKAKDPEKAWRILSHPKVLAALNTVVDQPFVVPVLNDVSVRSELWEPLEYDAVFEHVHVLGALANALSESLADSR